MIVNYTVCDKCDDKISPDQVLMIETYKGGNVLTTHEFHLCCKCTTAFREFLDVDIYYQRRMK